MSDLAASFSSAGYADGFGRRTLVFDRVSGVTLERLTLRAEFGAFERALRDRAGLLQDFDDERFARVKEVRTGSPGYLLVDSEQVTGDRLGDLLDAATDGPEDRVPAGVDVGLGFLLEVLPALGTLHSVARVTHGAIAPGRMILTPAGQVVLLDAIYGQVLDRLQFTRARLWNEFGLAMRPSRGPARFDAAADVAQAALTGIMLVLGRPIGRKEFPAGLGAALDEVIDIAQIRGSGRFGTALRGFLERTLPLPEQRPFGSAEQALDELHRIAESDIGVPACRSALSGFAEEMRRASPAAFKPMRPAEARRAPAPAAPPVVVTITPEPPAAWRAAEPEPPSISMAFDPSVLERTPVAERPSAPPVVPVPPSQAGSVPADMETQQAVSMEPAPAPEAVLPPQQAVAVDAPIVTPPAPPAASAPAVPAAELPAASPRRKRDRGPRAKRDRLRSTTDKGAPRAPAPPPPEPLVREPLVREPAAPQVAAPPPAPPRPVAVPTFTPPMPFANPAAQPQAASPYMQSTGRVWTAPPVAPPAITVVQPVPPAIPVPSGGPVRIKAEPPKGYTPPKPQRPIQSDDAVAAIPSVQRGRVRESSGFPWKIAAAAVVVLTIGAAAGRNLLLGGEGTADASPAPPASAEAMAPSSVYGTLVVTTQPAGAKVLIDGKPAGETPLTVKELAPGKKTITLQAAAGTVRRTVRVDAGKTSTVDVPLISGWVAVYAPIVLEIAAGGRNIGNTQQNRMMLAPGRHTLTFTNKNLGYSDTQTVDIEPGEERRVNIDPRGTVSLNAQPWAEVWIDGKRAGETPLANLSVTLGTRHIVFKHPQLGERKVTQTIKADVPWAISVDMTKPQ